MSKIQSIVEGEASESDSEEDLFERKVKHVNETATDAPHGVVVVGEAPESDDDSSQQSSPKSLKQSNSDSLTSPTAKENSNTSTDTLLLKKLSECNVSLRNNIVSLLKSTVQGGLEQLTDAEKLLISSQIRVQGASGSVRTFSSNTSLLVNKLTNSSSYLPHINIPDEDIPQDSENSDTIEKK